MKIKRFIDLLLHLRMFVFGSICLLYLIFLLAIYLENAYVQTSSPAQPNCFVSQIQIPIIYNDYFGGQKENEPNNSVSKSNGSLLPNIKYFGDYKDSNDYFRFHIMDSGKITLTLKGENGTTDSDIFDQETQFILIYRGDNYLTPPPQPTTRRAIVTPYSISHDAKAGWYVIRVFAPPELSLYFTVLNIIIRLYLLN